jgi:hypothetical protein
LKFTQESNDPDSISDARLSLYNVHVWMMR